jgi:hypothetical protein
MNDTLSHDQLEELLPAAALEILEGNELLQVTAHARECAECARLLASYREVVARLATTLPEQPFPPAPSARLRARLLARTGREPAASATSPAPQTSRLFSLVNRWAGWAVAAGLAGLLLIHHSVHRPVDYGWLAAGVLTLVVLLLAVYVRIQQVRLKAGDGQRAADERLESSRPK